jgi:hypothetical protein
MLFDHTHSICKQIIYAEADSVNFRLFFASLELPLPSEGEMLEFRARYKEVIALVGEQHPVRLRRWCD